jgi:tRNA 2-thiouridine synthesizing protein A
MTAADPPIRSLVNALAAGDLEGVAAVFVPDARFRALLPREDIDTRGAEEAAAWFWTWFGDAEQVAITALDVRSLGAVTTFRFRARAKKPRGWSQIEQVGVCELEDGCVASMRLACSGFQYEPGAEADTLDGAAEGTAFEGGERQGGASEHHFDAGDLGCGSGLPQAFRERIAGVALGDVLTVVTRDPSAREDLPALARMLGHHVRSVERGKDGTTMITVERGR